MGLGLGNNKENEELIEHHFHHVAHSVGVGRANEHMGYFHGLGQMIGGMGNNIGDRNP